MIQSLISLTLSNTLGALVLAVATVVVTRFVRTPALAHAFWILVLVKLVSPAVVELPVRLPGDHPLLALRAPGAHTPKVDSGVSSRLGETRPPQWAGLSETGGSESQRDSATLSSAEIANVRSGDSLFDVENSNSIVSPPEQLPRARHDDSETAEPNGVVFYRQVQVNWQQWVCAIWGSGIAIWFLVLWLRLRRFRKWLKKTQPASAVLRLEFEQLALEIGLKKLPELREVDGTCPPLTWAMWGRPVVLLPKSLIENLTGDERRVLLLHELAHLRRRDHWVRWLELFVTGLQWWQPLAWFARGRVRLASEQCCDAWVVRRFPELARTYAATLLKTVDFLAEAREPLPIGATGFGEARQLKRRFEVILKEGIADRLASKLWIGIALIALVIMPLSVRAIWAENAKPPAEEFKKSAEPPSQSIAATKASMTSDDQTSFGERLRRLEASVERLAKIVEAQNTGKSDHQGVSRTSDAQSDSGKKTMTERRFDQLTKAQPVPDISGVPESVQKELQLPNIRGYELERAHKFADIQRDIQVCERIRDEASAARNQYRAAQTAYEAGTLSFDQLLEAQRKSAEAQDKYSQSFLSLLNSNSQTLARFQRQTTVLKLFSLLLEGDEALRVWKEIKDDPKSTKDKEAQAREQYFLFRTGIEEPVKELLKQ